MSWTLYRWTWCVRAPLYLGLPPAGSLNRTRIFVPARTLWGALTAELARHEAVKDNPNYKKVGRELHENARLGYLFPSERTNDQWRAWLPKYCEHKGLVWTREGDTPPQYQPDRAFRRRILNAKQGTSIDPAADTAEDGSLRETECIQTRWRAADGPDEPPVGMTGHVFLRGGLRRRLKNIRQLFVGGDTRYGLGLIEREGDMYETDKFFGDPIELNGNDSPCVVADVVRGHAVDKEDPSTLRGDKERVLGWDNGTLRNDVSILWRPGSSCSGSYKWTIEEHGLWRHEPSCTPVRPTDGVRAGPPTRR